jgi:hypothetical protein
VSIAAKTKVLQGIQKLNGLYRRVVRAHARYLTQEFRLRKAVLFLAFHVCLYCKASGLSQAKHTGMKGMHTQYGHNILATLESNLTVLLQCSLSGFENVDGRPIHDIGYLTKLLNISEWQKLDEKPAQAWGTKVCHVGYPFVYYG